MYYFQIYEYRGAAAAGDLVAGYPSDLLNADADAHHRIRTHIFYRFFKVLIQSPYACILCSLFPRYSFKLLNS